MIELYHFWSSVCSMKVRFALEEKGVEWQSRYIDLFTFDQLTPEYLQINPYGVVPTLVHNGQSILESSIINEYIDEALAGPDLSPSDPVTRARMREFIKQCDEGLPAIVLPTMMKYIAPKLRRRWGEDELKRRATERPTKFYQDMHKKGVEDRLDPKELQECYAKIGLILDRMQKELSDNRSWLFGDFSLGDIAVAPYLFRLSALGDQTFWSADLRPAVNEWWKRMLAREAFQRAASWPDESGGGYAEVGLHEAKDDLTSSV